MVGVVTDAAHRAAAEEFFELFKTPWEMASNSGTYDVLLLTAGQPLTGNAKVVFRFEGGKGASVAGSSKGQVLSIKGRSLPFYGPVSTGAGTENIALEEVDANGVREIRIGYDLFAEVQHLLTVGQPPEHAVYPTLDLHIEILRELIVEAGVPVVEVAPAPHDCSFITCLTHDIDFVSLRQHAFDRTMLGYVYRSTVGGAVDLLQGRRSSRQCLQSALALCNVPFVMAGVISDPWLPFPRYLEVERGKPATYFIIPFKNRPGKAPAGRTSSPLRATRYGAADVADWLRTLRENGCEVALHGIDAWSDAGSARAERDSVEAASGGRAAGLRMHWLYFSDGSYEALDQAGFDYDSTCGFNDAVGYKAGTAQVFKPLGSTRLLELPMHIQDTALFYPGRMHLNESDAWALCMRVLGRAKASGGVLTLLWHDRSLVPERLWGDFYKRLLREVEKSPVWFASAEQTVRWFRERRAIRFERVVRSGNRIAVHLSNVVPAERFAIKVTWLGSEGAVRTEFAPLDAAGEVVFNLPAVRDGGKDSHAGVSPERAGSAFSA